MQRSAALAIVLAACSREARMKPAPGPATPVVSTDAAVIAVAAPDAAPPDAAVAMTPIGAWGVLLAVPDGATSNHEAAAERHTLRLATGEIIELHRPAIAGPKTYAEAARQFDFGDDLAKWGDGTTAAGAFWALRTFEVREGFEGMKGQTVHHLTRVSRAFAILPIDDQHHVRCTGFLERDVDSADDPVLQRLAKVCSSLRRAK